MKNTERIEQLEKQVSDLEEYVRRLKTDTIITTTSAKLDFIRLVNIIIDEYPNNKKLKELEQDVIFGDVNEDEED